ncbi:hypothetical protein Barb4_01635 [Bacteroidales bacterium Barb4]|nr:hypothetical protein Barb4_01635 [Bacteroidales bacterium Barb4]
MPEQTIISFCRKGFCFGLNMLFPGDNAFVRLPITACYPVHIVGIANLRMLTYICRKKVYEMSQMPQSFM